MRSFFQVIAIVLCLVAGVMAGPAAAADAIDKTALERAIRKLNLDQPSNVADATQTGALPGTDASAIILARGNLPRLFAFALENALGSSDAKAVTLSLDLFSIVAATDSSVIWDQTKYERAASLRRVTGSVTLGGGTDTSTTAPARELTDDVTGRVSFRLIGSRDRRDHAKEFGQLKMAMNEFNEAVVALTQTPGLFERYQAAGNDKDRQAEALYEALQGDPLAQDRIRAALAHYREILDSARRDIDQSLLVTLHVAGEFHRADVGRNRLHADLVGEMGWPFTWTLNAGFTSEEPEGGRQLQELRVASGLSHRFLAGSALSTDGIDLTLALAGEARNEHRLSVWSFNTKLDVPLQVGIRLTTSVTWASRRERVNEKLVSGHVGLSYDLQLPGGSR